MIVLYRRIGSGGGPDSVRCTGAYELSITVDTDVDGTEYVGSTASVHRLTVNWRTTVSSADGTDVDCRVDSGAVRP